MFSSLSPRPLVLNVGSIATPKALYIGKGSLALEVALVETATQPNSTNLREWWRLRVGGRSAPVLLVAGMAKKLRFAVPQGTLLLFTTVWTSDRSSAFA